MEEGREACESRRQARASLKADARGAGVYLAFFFAAVFFAALFFASFAAAGFADFRFTAVFFAFATIVLPPEPQYGHLSQDSQRSSHARRVVRDSVRAEFVGFSVPFEGLVRWLYADVKGYLTIAIGILVDDLETKTPPDSALSLPLLRSDGTPASRAEIAAEWSRVKSDPQAARLGYRWAEKITKLRLDNPGVQAVVERKLDFFDVYLAKRFAGYSDWPADAQLATLSMSWACGPAFHFPQLEACLAAGDFVGASNTCHMNETGNPGLAPRNRANVTLFRNAARVVALGLDPVVLQWPQALTDERPTDPPVLNPEDEEEDTIIHPMVDFGQVDLDPETDKTS